MRAKTVNLRLKNFCSRPSNNAVKDWWLKWATHLCTWHDDWSNNTFRKLLDSVPVAETSAKRSSRTKSLPSTYKPDIRTSGWLKLKRDYIDGMSDSLDVIPVGAWHGNGRKAQWWSPVLLALWDPETGRPVALCKCMSGMFYISPVTRELSLIIATTFSYRLLWRLLHGMSSICLPKIEIVNPSGNASKIFSGFRILL